MVITWMRRIIEPHTVLYMVMVSHLNTDSVTISRSVRLLAPMSESDPILHVPSIHTCMTSLAIIRL